MDRNLTRVGRIARRFGAATPLALAVFGLAMAAGSTPRPEIDRRAERVARLTRGDLGPRGLQRLAAGMDPAELALAVRADPQDLTPLRLGLTPGWDSLTLAGKPAFGFGPTGLDAQRMNAAVPLAAGALRAAKPFDFNPASAEDRRRAMRCLTQAIYYEAALEPTIGQEGVAQVILNRVRDPNYPNTVCGVVFEGAERVTGCQFSFTCDGALALAPAPWAWDRARSVAQRALAGHVSARVGTATHYHADYVRPWWAPTLTKIDQIGAHIFYRWKGLSGESSAFSQAYSGHEPLIDEARFARPRILVATAAADDAALVEAAAAGQPAVRTVEIDGRTRTVGVASLGGRRQPTPEEVASINRNLAAFEGEPAAPATPPPGVVSMDVVEIGRPSD